MVLNVHRNHKAYWGKGVWRWRRRSRLYTYLYNVTSRMIPALRWAAMRAILMFSVGSDEQSHRTVSTNHNLFWRERKAEAVSNRGPSAYQPNALPLGQTGSRQPSVCQICCRRIIKHVFTYAWGNNFLLQAQSTNGQKLQVKNETETIGVQGIFYLRKCLTRIRRFNRWKTQ